MLSNTYCISIRCPRYQCVCVCVHQNLHMEVIRILSVGCLRSTQDMPLSLGRLLNSSEDLHTNRHTHRERHTHFKHIQIFTFYAHLTPIYLCVSERQLLWGQQTSQRRMLIKLWRNWAKSLKETRITWCTKTATTFPLPCLRFHTCTHTHSHFCLFLSLSVFLSQATYTSVSLSSFNTEMFYLKLIWGWGYVMMSQCKLDIFGPVVVRYANDEIMIIVKIANSSFYISDSNVLSFSVCV